MEQFNAFWESIKPYVLSVTSSTAFNMVIMAVVTALIKSYINKKFDATTMHKLYNDAFESIFDRIKGMIFSMNIEPLVTSKMKGIQEIAVSEVKTEVAELREMCKMQTMLLGSFMAYFNNSVGIPEEVKANAKALYDNAMATFESKEEPTPIECTIEVDEPTKKEVTPKNNIAIER